MVDLALVPLFLCVRTKLPIELFPREAQRALKRKRPIDEPEVQVEAEWRPLERLENVQVEQDPVATLSVAVLSVAAAGVGPVLIGSLDGGPSRHGYIHRPALATRRAAGSVLYDLPFCFSSVMDR